MDRCKIIRRVQKWHPFGLRIYIIWSIFLFKSWQLHILELVFIIFYDFLSISIDFTREMIRRLARGMGVFMSLAAPRGPTERSQPFPELSNLSGKRCQLITVAKNLVLECEMRKCQIIYYIRMRQSFKAVVPDGSSKDLHFRLKSQKVWTVISLSKIIGV